MDPGTHSYDDNPIEAAPPNMLLGDQEEEEDDALSFSDYGESILSSGFTSLASYVLRHSHQDGRRYQSLRIGGYPIPNDAIEQEREEMKHRMIKRLLDGHDFCSPLGDNPQKILDIGTGVGLWAIDVADKYPSAQVTGIDLSPIQTPIIPYNVLWRIDDIESTAWTPPYSDVDLMHFRSIITTLREPVRIIESAYQNLKPGGWIEFQDCSSVVGCDDDTMPADYPLGRFLAAFNERFAPANEWNPFLIYRLPDLLKSLGFVNVHFRRHKIPMGAWARDQKQRELGLFMSRHVLWHFICAVLVKWPQLGLESKEEAEALEHDIRKAFDNSRIHAYIPWSSVWAQKPNT